MAKLDLNSALRGIQGAVDGWVYRRYGDRTILARRPGAREGSTPGQAEARLRFSQAAAYAKSALADPVQRAAYLARTPQRALFSYVLTDYLRPPVVDAIVVTDYHGAVGDPLVIQARDNVEVQGVTVEVRNAADVVVEQGPAVAEVGGWRYLGQVARAAGSTVTIRAVAVDRPGHTGSLQVMYTQA